MLLVLSISLLSCLKKETEIKKYKVKTYPFEVKIDPKYYDPRAEVPRFTLATRGLYWQPLPPISKEEVHRYKIDELNEEEEDNLESIFSITETERSVKEHIQFLKDKLSSESYLKTHFNFKIGGGPLIVMNNKEKSLYCFYTKIDERNWVFAMESNQADQEAPYFNEMFSEFSSFIKHVVTSKVKTTLIFPNLPEGWSELKSHGRSMHYSTISMGEMDIQVSKFYDNNTASNQDVTVVNVYRKMMGMEELDIKGASDDLLEVDHSIPFTVRL